MTNPNYQTIPRGAAFALSLVWVTLGVATAKASGEFVQADQNSGGQPFLLLPAPQKCRPDLNDSLPLKHGRMIWLRNGDRDALLQAGRIVQSALIGSAGSWDLTAFGRDEDVRIGATLEIDPDRIHHVQGYRLRIQPARIELVARDEAGLFYGAQTFRQIAAQSARSGHLPCLTIEDWPDFPHRGFLLDISRDKVPTMETLFRLVDLMASLKLNQLQLYTEAAFAYRDHPTVWNGSSPMTGEQVMELDAYCRQRHIELVPNQNTFAHMERWLRHEPYARLAERPGGSTLCPTDPGSLELVGGLLDELLPHFRSRQVNVGCDETDEVGKGRSKSVVERLGYGQVYVDYLRQVQQVVRRNGRRMQFWADMILRHPELIEHAPADSTLMVWYYEDEHPYFRDNLPKLAAAGLPFYVCPGSSSWASLLGRTKNAMTNLEEAARYGRANGAIGYLICNWGIYGFWEHLPISYLPLAYGAGVSWAYEANRSIDLPRALDLHVFHDRAGVMGRLAYDLGNAYLETGVYMQDGTPMGCIMYYAALHPEFTDKWYRKGELKIEGCQKALEWVERAIARLPDSRMAHPEAELIAAEFQNDANLFRHACRLAIALLQTPSLQVKDLPPATREALAGDLERIMPELKRLWLARNRLGGLETSYGIAEKLLWAYRREHTVPPDGVR